MRPVVYMCVVVEIPGNTLEAFEAPNGRLIPQIFILRFLTRLLFASIGVTTSGICNVKQLPLNFFDKCSGLGLFPLSRL